VQVRKLRKACTSCCVECYQGKKNWLQVFFHFLKMKQLQSITEVKFPSTTMWWEIGNIYYSDLNDRLKVGLPLISKLSFYFILMKFGIFVQKSNFKTFNVSNS
jgi:hypothetical protein